MRCSWTLNSFAVRLSDIAQTGPGRSSLTPSSDFVVLRAAEFLLRGSRSSAAGQADSSEAHRQEEILFRCPQNTASPASLASSPWRWVPGRKAKISPAREGAAVKSGLQNQQVTLPAGSLTTSLERRQLCRSLSQPSPDPSGIFCQSC